MSYQLVDGSWEGDHLGLAPLAPVVDKDDFATASMFKQGGSLKTEVAIAPSAAADLVAQDSGWFQKVSDFLSNVLKRPEAPSVQTVPPPATPAPMPGELGTPGRGALIGVGLGLLALYMLTRRR